LCVDVIVLSENFLKYMEAFRPFFAAGLKNIEEYQVCRCATRLSSSVREYYHCSQLSQRFVQQTSQIFGCRLFSVAAVVVVAAAGGG